MIKRDDIYLYKNNQPIDFQGLGMYCFNRITCLKYYIGNIVVTSDQVININIDCRHEVIVIEAVFLPQLYNLLKDGSIVEKIEIDGLMVDVVDAESVSFHTTIKNLKFKNLVTSFETNGKMMICFEEAN